MPRTRDGEISGEVLDLFARNIELRTMGAQDDDAPDELHPELI